MKTYHSKIRFKICFSFVLAVSNLVFSGLSFTQVKAAVSTGLNDSPKGGGECKFPANVYLSEEAHADIKIKLQESIETLRAQK